MEEWTREILVKEDLKNVGAKKIGNNYMFTNEIVSAISFRNRIDSRF
jgi:hypothetical protein